MKLKKMFDDVHERDTSLGTALTVHFKKVCIIFRNFFCKTVLLSYNILGKFLFVIAARHSACPLLKG